MSSWRSAGATSTSTSRRCTSSARCTTTRLSLSASATWSAQLSQGRPASNHHLRQDLCRAAAGFALGTARGSHRRGVHRHGSLRTAAARPRLPCDARSATQPGLHSAFLRVQRPYRQVHPDRDLPVLTVHELRHTHASLLFEAGSRSRSSKSGSGMPAPRSRSIPTHISCTTPRPAQLLPPTNSSRVPFRVRVDLQHLIPGSS